MTEEPTRYYNWEKDCECISDESNEYIKYARAIHDALDEVALSSVGRFKFSAFVLRDIVIFQTNILTEVLSEPWLDDSVGRYYHTAPQCCVIFARLNDGAIFMRGLDGKFSERWPSFNPRISINPKILVGQIAKEVTHWVQNANGDGPMVKEWAKSLEKRLKGMAENTGGNLQIEHMWDEHKVVFTTNLYGQRTADGRVQMEWSKGPDSKACTIKLYPDGTIDFGTAFEHSTKREVWRKPMTLWRRGNPLFLKRFRRAHAGYMEKGMDEAVENLRKIVTALASSNQTGKILVKKIGKRLFIS